MNYIIECLKGIVIGIANIIPGVSGGTMMVSMGIYDKIIGSITGIFKNFKKSIITLLPYIAGMGIGIVGLSFIIKYLLEIHPFQTSMLFVGLILGGLPVLLGHIDLKKQGISKGVVFLTFFAFIIVLQFIGGGENTSNVIIVTPLEIIKLFFVGVIAAATMVIPGVSGSMMLMIMGYYYPILTAITDFMKALLKFNIPELLRTCGILVPAGIGIVVGIFAIAKVIEFLLKKFEGHTYCGILGLVAASPIVIFMINGIPAMNVLIVITGVLAFAAGACIAFFLGRE